MPLYEYRCESCGRRFELLRRFGQRDDDILCPSCGDARIEKEFSTFSGGSAGAGASSGGCSPSGRFT